MTIINAATLVASSSDETLLLTRKGEVLVCCHLDCSRHHNCDEEELSRHRLGYESQNYGVNSSLNINENIIRSKSHCGECYHIGCCTAEKEDFSAVATDRYSLVSCSSRNKSQEDEGDTVLRKCMACRMGTMEGDYNLRIAGRKSLNISKPIRKMKHPGSTSMSTRQPLKYNDSKCKTQRAYGGDEWSISVRAVDSIFQGNDGCLCATIPNVVEGSCDMVELNDVRLPEHDNFFCNGNSSHPVMSFDYHGYEPPTPEAIKPCEGLSFILFPEGMTDHELASIDHMTDFPPSSNLSIQNNVLLHATPGTESCDRDISLTNVSDPSFALPGVPSFLHHLSQIRITSLSAHPRGHHVLLISEEGLLFSYGSNECGQLGLGEQSLKRSTLSANGGLKHCFKVTVPSIVTPLLENGGKTINCAAGIDYSLVVVKTEWTRIAHRKSQHQQRARRNMNSTGVHSSAVAHECNAYHQMYGFGNNKHRKLGLLDPDVPVSWRDSLPSNGYANLHRNCSTDRTVDARRPLEAVSPSPLISSLASFADDSTDGANEAACNYVFLPRRVALYCKVIPQEPSTSLTVAPVPPPYGLFSVAASINHSAALVRRPSGAIELYTWGKGDDGALGLAVPAAATAKINHPPSAMFLPTEKRNAFENGVHSSLMPTESPVQSQVPHQIVVTPTLLTLVSFPPPVPSAASIVTLPHSHESNHRWCDIKFSANNPNSSSSGSTFFSECASQGAIRSLLSPSEYLVKVTLGPSCTHVITSKGRWLAFGSSVDGLLGLGQNVCSTGMPTEVRVSLATSSKGFNPNNVGDKNGEETLVLHEQISTICVGDKHAVAVTSQGDVLAWGRSVDGVLGQTRTRSCSTNLVVPSPLSTSFFDSVCVESIGTELDDKLVHHIHSMASLSPMNGSTSSGKVAYAHAGLDISLFIQKSGSVLSSGQRSGRLGQGYVCMDILSPRHLFGGMELWCDEY